MDLHIVLVVELQPAVPQWDDAIVGDDVTNPEPSFIGKNY